MSLEYNKKNVILAKNLRNNATPEENHLWYDFLRRYTPRFQRQKMIDNVIADFYCHKAKLVIEIDGSQHRTNEGKVKDECQWLPRLGFEIKVPYEKSKFEYFGMGPYENYIDMHHASMIDRYYSDADSEYVNYIVPQEHGNHTNTKYLKIENGLLFKASNKMDINVSHYTSKMLMDATHQNELIKDESTNIRIDYKNSGVGSNACGPKLLEKYKLSEKEICFEFYIR